VVGLALAIGLVVAVGVALAVLTLEVPLVGVLGPLLLVAVLAVTFLPMYYVLPPVEVSVREVLPGAVAAAVGWVVLQTGFRL
jgi:membrane protein